MSNNQQKLISDSEVHPASNTSVLSTEERIKKAFDYASDSTKQIIALSTGIVALTVSFSKDLFEATEPSARILFVIAWVFYTLSIVAGVATLLQLTGNIEKQKKPSIYEGGIVLCSAAQILFFLLGTFFIVGFASKSALRVKPEAELIGDPKLTSELPIIEMSHLGTVGPFGPSRAFLDESDADARSAISTLTRKLMERSREHKLVCLILVASSDQQQLSAASRSQHKSNRSLALSRAEWLERQLALDLPGVPILAFISGPLNVGQKPSTEDLAEDRSVAVYGIWNAATSI